MKVLLAIHGFPPTHYAGAERHAERVAQWLVKHGHHVEVFTCERLDSPETGLVRSQENGITIHRFNYDLKTGDYFKNLYDDPRVGAGFRQVLAQNTFDIVHIISGYLLGGQIIHAAKEAGIPVALTLTEFWFMCYRLNLLTHNNELCVGPESIDKCMQCIAQEQRRYRLPTQKAPALMKLFWTLTARTPFVQRQRQQITRRQRLLIEALDAVDVVICPSRFIGEKFREYEFNTSRFVYVRHGLNTPLHHAHVPCPMGTLRLGYMGQIKPHKGVDLLIEAVLPLLDQGAKVSLDIWGSSAGNDTYRERLQQQTQAYPQIRWPGSYRREELDDILSAMDVIVVPSRWYENSPTVILEAQTYKLPVITTGLGGMQELIQHDVNGLLFELDNSADLRRQIERLIQEPELVSKLRGGIPRMPTIDDEVRAIFNHYQSVVKQHQSKVSNA